MNREETIKILAVLKVAYPTFYSKQTKADLQQTVSVWEMMFAADDYKIVNAAVMAVINSDTNGFPPNIGTIKEQIRRFSQPETDTAMDAWIQVRKAISFYNSKQNFDALPELARKIVGSANQLREWAIMEAEDVNTVVQSNFLKAYRAKEKSYLEQNALPADVQKLIGTLQQNMSIDAPKALNGAPFRKNAKSAPLTLEKCARRNGNG